MRLRGELVLALALPVACCSCSTASRHLVPAETVAAMAEPGSPETQWGEPRITSIPNEELAIRRTQAAMRFEGERVMFLRLRAFDGTPLAHANVFCPASRVGAIADEGGIAWLHGMQADSVEVRIVALARGTSVSTGFVAIVAAGEVMGFNIRTPKGVPVVAEP